MNTPNHYANNEPEAVMNMVSIAVDPDTGTSEDVQERRQRM